MYLRVYTYTCIYLRVYIYKYVYVYIYSQWVANVKSHTPELAALNMIFTMLLRWSLSADWVKDLGNMWAGQD